LPSGSRTGPKNVSANEFFAFGPRLGVVFGPGLGTGIQA